MNLASERAYPTAVANSTLLPFLLVSLMQQKNAPTVSGRLKKEYDYIIVGAGSAGSTLASRLSELPCVSVLLLEAGKAPPVLNDIPAFGRDFWFTDIDWQYKTVPQKHTGKGLINKQVIWPSGKALGGSSTINAMLYVRGNRENYDNWAAQGAKGWSYEDVLPYFVRMEDNKNPEYFNNGFHGIHGPVTVEKQNYDSDLKRHIFAAAKNIGYRIGDSNGPIQTGFYDLQGTLRNGQRCSTAKAYLVPAENRTNLDILTNAHVRKVTFQGNRATGVVFDYQNSLHEVKANREVIMSAGTVNTAQLLMLSGIGPRKHLEELNIPVVADLPVGENFHDHCSTIVHFSLNASSPFMTEEVRKPQNIQKYIDFRSGPLSSPEIVTAMAFLNGDSVAPGVDFPNYELYFFEGSTEIPKHQFGLKPEVYEQVYERYENIPLLGCFSSILQPRSRGVVKLNSTNPYDSPLIDPNYFDDPKDLEDMVQGMKTCLKIGRSESLQKFGSKLFETLYPGCEHLSNDGDATLRCQAQSWVVTMSHQVGTAKMGDPKDPSTVVDPELRVKGIQGLRVVDASVMPIVPSGNTNVPTIMVAEKASDIIRGTIDCNAPQRMR